MSKAKPIVFRDIILRLLRKRNLKDYVPKNGAEEAAKGLIMSSAEGNASANIQLLKIIGQNPDKPQNSNEDNPFTD